MVLAKDLEPHRVSGALGLRPSQWWRRGEKKCVTLKGGKTLHFRSVHRWGGWKFHFQSLRTERALIRKVTTVATELSMRKSQLRALVKNGHEIYLVSLVQHVSSIVIPPELHGLLGGLGIHLQIDFWPYAEK
jgi:hypothetical protein